MNCYFTAVCNPQCQNGGYCSSPNYCQCSNAYTGPYCNQAVCDPPCLNGGTCASPKVCSCPSGQYKGSQCQTPICTPDCENGGTCVSPGKCACKQTFIGDRCQDPLCAHHSPCFPGNCSDTISCQCSDGFTGDTGLNRCKTLDSYNTPIITKATAFLANIERTGDKEELYRFMTDSSEPNSTKVDELWLSDKDYNYINADFTAILTLTVIAVNGGFRKLKTESSTVVDPFIGQTAEKSMMFRFDFRKPVHCRLDDVPCTSIAFNVTKDVTKSAIEFTWDGWDDVLSGIGKYQIEEFFLRSSITTDDSSPMVATSAAEETSYKWQNNLTNPISVSWKSHFWNNFLERNKLLSPVSPYKYFNSDANFYKAVPDNLEDKDGMRMLKGITNAHGVVKFQYTYRHSNQGNNPPNDWKDPTDNFMSQTASFDAIRSNGDSLNVWVKAIDILGNEKIDMIKVYFDETPPDNLGKITFIKNIENSTLPFSSRLIVDTRDTDSGIYGIRYSFLSNNTGAVFKSDFIPGNKSNITDLGSLNGIDEYSGPTNLHVETTYSNAVRLRWTVSPTCYERSRITVSGVSKDGKRFLRLVDKDSDHFDLNGLEAETTYNLSFVTEYGDQKSDPIFLTFHTIEEPAALTAGGIAGISTDKEADHFDLNGLEAETTYNLSFITEYGDQKSDPIFLTFHTIEEPAALTAGGIAGISTVGPYMVLEFCEVGQLNSWLQQQKNTANVETSEQLCRICYGICKGMLHLESRKLVHRRLAARNVLLTSELEPKIYGFCPQQQEAEGENKDDDGDTKEDKSRIPVKWTAPECLVTMKHATPKSDVWSFGVVLWEIFSFGEVPYPGTRSRDVQAYLRNGYRMDKPEFANDFYYNIMKQCWKMKPKQRPSFRDMTADIGKTFNSAPSDDFYYYSEKH
uniref:Megakaryocyte-associated tyrosine-protein kinase n=1 Tax=Magallana gigas TaxID=29159 RepID=K1PLN0_MAGGI